ncbi:hypothetical protein CDL12_02176 [Handroanthus impetiginosus]|uniref:30S ribosomal protein S9 n=1 Tax=Handroanthus impetiginosus TaxID=429701 RepID=A0A2G9I5Q4_9LAMI|nr:hypothetical protein CDL12_02176 [Handroanthus impetiginosus]
MLSRFIFKSSQFQRLVTRISSQTHIVNARPVSQNPLFSNPSHYIYPKTPHFSFFSNKGDNGNSVDQDIDLMFSVEPGSLEGFNDQNGEELKNDDKTGYLFGGNVSGGGDEEGAGVEDQPWSFSEGKEGEEEDVFGVEAESGEISGLGDGLGERILGSEKSEQDKQLESEEKALTAVLKGPNRAFGDLIAASGVTDEMLDSLIALKDFEGIQGLPPLSMIEDKRYDKNTKKSSRAEIERQKQEEVAKACVRRVDEKGRACGTGKQKCSIASVWTQPGEGKFVVNDKEFDVYFPVIDHRAASLAFLRNKDFGNVGCQLYC